MCLISDLVPEFLCKKKGSGHVWISGSGRIEYMARCWQWPMWIRQFMMTPYTYISDYYLRSSLQSTVSWLSSFSPSNAHLFALLSHGHFTQQLCTLYICIIVWCTFYIPALNLHEGKSCMLFQSTNINIYVPSYQRKARESSSAWSQNQWCHSESRWKSAAHWVCLGQQSRTRRQGKRRASSSPEACLSRERDYQSHTKSCQALCMHLANAEMQLTYQLRPIRDARGCCTSRHSLPIHSRRHTPHR